MQAIKLTTLIRHKVSGNLLVTSTRQGYFATTEKFHGRSRVAEPQDALDGKYLQTSTETENPDY